MPIFLFQAVLPPRTPWDPHPLMHAGVPCVVKLESPRRQKSQTQPHLVGMVLSIPLLDQGCGTGLWLLSLAWVGAQVWGRGIKSVSHKKESLPREARAGSHCHGVGGSGGPPLSAAPVCLLNRLSLSGLPSSDRSRKGCQQEKCTCSFRRQAEEQAGRVASGSAARPVVPGSRAPSTSCSGFHLRVLSSCRALSASHCVSAFPCRTPPTPASSELSAGRLRTQAPLAPDFTSCG